ncbi:HD domain-containing protein [Mucilaginibacter rubeus]|nr:HD domain-containing protein [Mucilaginibacter rubeus]QTE55476.1 HD domain-containing protein [Mucilaginibacter rubeus]QTE65062.1 HD domain-containing protein [Mucilaginibacter rubeus]
MHFHNIGHAEDVAYAVNRIGLNSSLPQEDLDVLAVAAWFHDTGYCFEYEGHENSSVDIAEGFLNYENCERSFIDKVLDCIWSTCFPQQPTNLLEQIICDADLYHFSKKNYSDYARRLRTEWCLVLHKTFIDQDWNLQNLEILRKHQFHTDYGRQILERRKQENIKMLNSAIVKGQ